MRALAVYKCGSLSTLLRSPISPLQSEYARSLEKGNPNADPKLGCCLGTYVKSVYWGNHIMDYCVYIYIYINTLR